MLMLFDSDSDENYDISDYSSKYEYENVEQVSDDFESDNDIIDTTKIKFLNLHHILITVRQA